MHTPSVIAYKYLIKKIFVLESSKKKLKLHIY